MQTMDCDAFEARQTVAAGDGAPQDGSKRDRQSISPPPAGTDAATACEIRARTIAGLDRHPALQGIEEQRAALERLGLPIPYGRPRESVSTSTIRIDGRDLLNFSGYNYLGLSGHPEVSTAAKAAIDQYGTSASASRLVSGETVIHGELERELADMLGTEACLVFVSGYGTNVSTIGHLFGPDDLIVHDALAHSSIHAGCQLSRGHRLSFPHNDVRALDRLLAEHRPDYERAVVVVEGVYSMDGDIAPLDRLIDVKTRHDAMLMVDEAHSIGVLGARGFGLGEHFEVSPADVDIWMGTLSKTLAACGGYVAGSSGVIECMRYSAPGFVYSVGLTPPDTAAALAALRVMRREPERVHHLQRLAAQFIAYARDAGLNTGTSAGSAVIPVILGESAVAMRVAHALFEAGINVHPFAYPVVEEGAARIRFFVTTMHTLAQLHETVDAVVAALDEL